MIRIAVLFVLWIASLLLFSFLNPDYLRVSNLARMMIHFSEIGIMGVAMTLLLISGSVDLSVASILALCAVMFGFAFRDGAPLPTCIVVSLTAGAAFGALNGLFIAILRLPAVVVTLATMALYRGLAMGTTAGQKVSGFPESLIRFGEGAFLLIPYPVWLLLLLMALGGLILNRTVWGRFVIACGANETVARFSGVPVSAIRFGLFVFSGFCSALASIVYVARFNTAKADAGLGWELDVIAATLLGGTPLTGGSGSLAGTLMGLILLSSLRRGLDLMAIGTEQQAVIVGAILIGAVAASQAHWQSRPILVKALAKRR